MLYLFLLSLLLCRARIAKSAVNPIYFDFSASKQSDFIRSFYSVETIDKCTSLHDFVALVISQEPNSVCNLKACAKRNQGPLVLKNDCMFSCLQVLSFALLDYTHKQELAYILGPGCMSQSIQADTSNYASNKQALVNYIPTALREAGKDIESRVLSWVQRADIMTSRNELVNARTSKNWTPDVFLTPNCLPTRVSKIKDTDTCDIISADSYGCTYIITSDIPEKMSGSKNDSSFTFIWSPVNPCSQEQCSVSGHPYLRDLSVCRSGQSPVGTEVVSSIYDISNIERKTTCHLNTIPASSTCKLNVYECNVPVCAKGDCDITVSPKELGLRFNFMSSNSMSISIQVSKDYYYFFRSGLTGTFSKEIDLPYWGEHTYKVRCNSNHYSSKVILTKKEYCYSSNSRAKIFIALYCLNINNLIWAFVVLCIAAVNYLLPWFLAYALSFVLSLLIFLIIFIPAKIFVRRCSVCCQIFVRKSTFNDHTCPKYCSMCGDAIGQEHLSHISTCSELKKTFTNPGLVLIKRVVMKVTKMTIAHSARVSTAIILICGSYLVSQAEAAGSITDMTKPAFEEEFNHLKDSGFLPMAGLFTGPNYRRQTVSLSSSNKYCKEVGIQTTCELESHVQSNLRLISGFASGYLLSAQDSTFNFDIKVQRVWGESAAVYQYTACKTTKVSVSATTCTEPCSKCKEKLFNEQGNITLNKYVEIPDVTSWSCEDNSRELCISISEGCFCGGCYHKADLSDCLDVYKIGPPKTFFTLCMVIQNRGMCLNLSTSTVLSNDDIGVISSTQKDPLQLPKFVAQDKSKPEFVLSGNINAKGQFAPQMGSIQFSKHTNYSISDCVSAATYRKVCQWGKIPGVLYPICCPDGYTTFKKDLISVPNYSMDKDRVIMSDLEMGEVTVNLKLPRLSITSINTDLAIIGFMMSTCSGCFDCEEGVVLGIMVDSKIRGLIAVECDKVEVNDENLQVDAGHSSYLISGKTSSQSLSITCSIKGTNWQDTKTCTFSKQPTNYHTSASAKTIDTTAGECVIKKCGSSGMSAWIWSSVGRSWTILIGTVIGIAVCALLGLFLYFWCTVGAPYMKGNNVVSQLIMQAKSKRHWQ